MKRSYYQSNLKEFLKQSEQEIIGILTQNSEFNVDQSQVGAWQEEIRILRNQLKDHSGHIFFEFAITRMGRSADVLLIIKHVLFVIEFKVGQKLFLNVDLDQVWDYALDLKNFHETSHHLIIAPILLATEAKQLEIPSLEISNRNDLFKPIKSNSHRLSEIIDNSLKLSVGCDIEISKWIIGRYAPTPTIIEAALALYNNHSVHDITRSEAEAKNLSETSVALEQIIAHAKAKKEKSICFVTGVPGAGKTLVGLNIATNHFEKDSKKGSVFLSGNGPLVAVLREALTRDKYHREKAQGKRIKKGEIFSEVKLFIQNVHHFRDEYLNDNKAPFDHIAIFDEAQRAWNHQQTAAFMKQKKNQPGFLISEPEFLISCLDRHEDWAVIICLVGGGQEINKGEAGISEWIESINRSFSHWKVYISSQLVDSEYAAGEALQQFIHQDNLRVADSLHLSVSIRSFRAERLSAFIKQLLDLNRNIALQEFSKIKDKYPIFITRDLTKAKNWIKSMAQGSERYGIIVSSQAQRLKPLAIDIRSPMDPVHWFLDGKEDVRSSFYLEDVATEFHVQGLELDWACITWDADFRFTREGWEHFSFVGDRWNQIKKIERKKYLKNAYRVLLTRARQGMVIVIPEGDSNDPTREPGFYNPSYEYLKDLGLSEL